MEENNNLSLSTRERKISKKTMKLINHKNNINGKDFYIINNECKKNYRTNGIESYCENTSNKENRNLHLTTKKNNNVIKALAKVKKKQSQRLSDITYEFPKPLCSPVFYNSKFTICKVNNKKNNLFDKSKPQFLYYQDNAFNVQTKLNSKILNNAVIDILKKCNKKNKSVNKTQSTNNINNSSNLNDSNFCNGNSLNNYNSVITNNLNNNKKNVNKRNTKGKGSCKPGINSLNLADIKIYPNNDKKYSLKINNTEGNCNDENIKDILQKNKKIKNLHLTNYLEFKNQKKFISKIKNDKNNKKNNSNNSKNVNRDYSKNNSSHLYTNINNTCLSNSVTNNNITLTNNISNILNRNSISTAAKKNFKPKLQKEKNKYKKYKLILNNIKIDCNWNNTPDKIENINLNKTKSSINKTSFTCRKKDSNIITYNYRHTQNSNTKKNSISINNFNVRSCRNYEKHGLTNIYNNKNERFHSINDNYINNINYSETIENSLKLKLNKISKKLFESDQPQKKSKKLKNTNKNDLNVLPKSIYTSRENNENYKELNSLNDDTMDNSVQKRNTTRNNQKKLISNEKNKSNGIKQLKKLLTTKFHTSKKDKKFSSKLNEILTKEKSNIKNDTNNNITQECKDSNKKVIKINNSLYANKEEENENKIKISDEIYDNKILCGKSNNNFNNQLQKKYRKNYKYIQTIYSIVSHNKLLKIFCQFFDNKDLTKFSLLNKKIYYFLKPYIYEKIRIYISRINNLENNSYNMGTKFFCNRIKIHLLNSSSLSNLSPVMLQTLYLDLLYEINEKYDVLIKKDLTRTLPGNISFEYGNSNYNKLYHILSAYCNYNKNIGYVQGMNFLAAHCLYIFKSEVESFEFLDAIIRKFNLEKLFGVQAEELNTKLYNISQELKKYTPNVNEYLHNINLNYDYFTCNWMITLFSNSMNVKYLFYVWDCMIIFGWKFFNCFVISVFEMNQNKILNTEISEMTNLKKNILKNKEFEKQFNEIIIRSFEHLIAN